MALQSEVSPPLVGDPNKDTKIDGDTKSEEENDSSQSTDEDVDLEEGEILDSGEEEEEEKKDLTNSSLKEAMDKNILKNIEQLVSQAKMESSPPNSVPKNISPHHSPLKMKKRPSKYMDHDRYDSASDQEDGWYTPSKKLKSKFDAKPIDYRMELEAYRGTPPSSPDRKHKDEKKKKRSSKKSKKSSRKSIKRKDAKGLRVMQYRKDAMRKKMCKFFKEGKCAKGSECPYSHASPLSFKKKELCKFYLSGHCNKGNDCIYMHNEFPCKFYHTGSECYAKDDCRFSHAPLTEEMERVLADYLKIPHGDDDYDRKRRSSPSPEPKAPPAKRTCLLGSPPRHIREAEETKRWQEEMLKQQQNHPGFKIHISSPRDGSPPPVPKPNFYQETLPSTPSPQKHRKNLGLPDIPVSASFPPPSTSAASGFPLPNTSDAFHQESPERYIYDDDYQEIGEMTIKQEPPDFSWTNMRGIEHNLPPLKNEMEPFVEPAQQDLDFTNDVKFDETTQFSEMESLTDGNEASPPNSVSQTVTKESEEESSNQGNIKAEKNEEKPADDSSSNQESPSPIVIPSHLPKKQQELFKRIQQHQRKNAMAASASDVSNSPKAFDSSEPQVKEEPEEVKEKTETEKDDVWYSSEDDDDDDTVEPLTNVLKKLQKEPPVVSTPVKSEPKPAADIMAMLNKIQQNTLEKNKAASESKPEAFLKNLLLGNIPALAENKQPALNNATTSTTSEAKRRTLLPDPQPIPASAAVKKEPPKDPRLRNRDPRLAASAVHTTVTLPILPKISMEQNGSKVIASVTTQEHITSSFSTGTTTVATESTNDSKPYKLHGIYTKPPNYTPYINASQSNPNLLKDPRLRRHMNLDQKKENNAESDKGTDSMKTIPIKNAPPIPKLLLKFDKSDSFNINIFESTTPKPVVENIQDSKIIRPKLTDPRMRKREAQSTGSNTPPHLVFENAPHKLKTEPIENDIKSYEKKWSPPILEKSWSPPTVEQKQTIKQEIKQEVDSDTEDPLRLQIDEGPQNSSTDVNDSTDSTSVSRKVKPTPASHLPRAIADPRMAKLHSPLDVRRPRITIPESSNKSATELKKLNHTSSHSDNSSDASQTAACDTAVLESEGSKTAKNVPKKHSSSEKNDDKKKTVHRNRKSSMDYASPLNSCDDSSKNLSYNSYNQRPPRTGTSKSVSDSSSVSNAASNLPISDLTPDFLSDNSLECDNNIDVNLKDRFKTIDPTASPFC